MNFSTYDMRQIYVMLSHIDRYLDDPSPGGMDGCDWELIDQDWDNMTLREIQEAVIRQRIDLYNGNKTQAADSLNINVKTIYNILKRKVKP